MINSRYLSQFTERRHVQEQAAFDLWMVHRPDVLRRALLECTEVPNFEMQIESIDRVMVEAFNASTYTEKTQDIQHLMDRSIAMLKKEWIPRTFKPNLARSGSQPIPVYSEPASRKILTYDILR